MLFASHLLKFFKTLPIPLIMKQASTTTHPHPPSGAKDVLDDAFTSIMLKYTFPFTDTKRKRLAYF